jgi:hypothetical protein
MLSRKQSTSGACVSASRRMGRGKEVSREQGEGQMCPGEREGPVCVERSPLHVIVAVRLFGAAIEERQQLLRMVQRPVGLTLCMPPHRLAGLADAPVRLQHLRRPHPARCCPSHTSWHLKSSALPSNTQSDSLRRSILQLACSRCRALSPNILARPFRRAKSCSLHITFHSSHLYN